MDKPKAQSPESTVRYGRHIDRLVGTGRQRKPPPPGLINYTAQYLAEILLDLHSQQDFAATYPWDNRQEPRRLPEIKPRLEGRLKLVQRKDNGTWVVLETIPNGKQEDTYEHGTTLFARLEKLERIILNSKPPPRVERESVTKQPQKELSLLETYGKPTE